MHGTARTHLPMLASAMVLVAFLAACGQPGPASTGSTASSESTAGLALAGPATTTATGMPSSAATTSRPATLSKTAAGKRYLEITKPYNVALEAFEHGFNSGESVSTLKRRALKVAEAADAEATALAATPWPSSVASLMADLAQTDGRLHTRWLAVAAADTRDSMLGKVRNLPSGADTGAKVRSLLGLPKYNENDY